VRELTTDRLIEALYTVDKMKRDEAIDALKNEISEIVLQKFPDNEKDINEVFETIMKEQVRRHIIENGIRPDNRKLDEIRPISCEVGLLPRTHGSGLFNRGQTQVLTIATLGASSDVQIIDGLGEEESKRYMHHYNFPAYSVGEVRPS
ncbi:polyribonucleotide nucleotidyltransferase, partial [Vibrio parahaemolyticus]|nr:polyribonucleotide nucleotidyltransferase [Vibrio parahaemolyticus]